ncbi:hypothetical protein OPQ81_002888 [Rhizoctonia solani]|nr:hypothetical protein OPQ81_002888 [Rhizoctonia solani]
MALSDSPSRIPRPIRGTTPKTSLDGHFLRHVSTDSKTLHQGYCPSTRVGSSKCRAERKWGYLAPTISSSRHQQGRQTPVSKRSAPINPLDTDSLNAPTRPMREERPVSRIPVLLRNRLKKPSPEGTASARPSRLPPPRVPTSHRTPNTPPPKYSECPESPRQSYETNLAPSPSASLERSPPLYCEHVSELEDHLYVFPHLPEDLESETTTPSLGFLPKHGAKHASIHGPETQRTSGSWLTSVEDKSHGSDLESSQGWYDDDIPASTVNIDPDLDDLSRAILGDIFAALEPIPMTRAVALRAYVNAPTTLPSVCDSFEDTSMINTCTLYS